MQISGRFTIVVDHVPGDKLARVQKAMEKELAANSLADVKKNISVWIK